MGTDGLYVPAPLQKMSKSACSRVAILMSVVRHLVIIFIQSTTIVIRRTLLTGFAGLI